MKTIKAFLLPFFLLASVTSAEVVRFDVESTEAIANGHSYGLAGSYERLKGRVHYAVDPGLAINKIVTDIEYAPTNSDGLVEFSSDFFLLRPKNVSAGNGALFFEVPNRGWKGALNRFNHARSSLDPVTAEDMGDGFLLQRGYSILWIGWQIDTPPVDDRLRAFTPTISDNGRSIEGLVRSDILVNETTHSFPLGNRGHIAYPVADPDDPRNVMTVRNGITAERETIPRDRWRFARLEDERVVADSSMVYLDSGFEPDRIYEVVYVSENPGVAGLGLAAIRDAISALKYDGANSVGVPGGVFDRAIAYGSSQSGRLLRSFLYDGFNGDTKQRKVFDGVLAHIGGAARGSFNQRFAQPSRAPGGAYEYPNRIFPFSDEAQTDPATGTQDGLLAHIAPGTMPKIFYTNSSTEYWRSIGAMTHVSIDGKADLELLDNVRTYHFAGTQHTPASFPSRTSAGDRQPNPNDYSWLLRSLLVEMDRWVVGDETPPENRYSTLAAGTLVPYEDFAFPAIPGVDTLAEVSTARALNFGSKLAADGIITQEPPTLGITYPFLVPQVDRDGNEIDGLRLPEIEVPLATHTGWSSPNPVSGVGVYAPFPRTAAERVAESDPRLSIEERYTDRAAYIGQVAEAAIKLIDGGYLLGEDLPSILEIAGRRWDHQMSDGAN